MTYPTQPTASHYINGQYVEDTAGAEIPVIYPATGEVIAAVYAGTETVVDKALAAAAAAQPAWAALTGRERGRILTRAAQIIRERNYDLSASLSGKQQKNIEAKWKLDEELDKNLILIADTIRDRKSVV